MISCSDTSSMGCGESKERKGEVSAAAGHNESLTVPAAKHGQDEEEAHLPVAPASVSTRSADRAGRTRTNSRNTELLARSGASEVDTGEIPAARSRAPSVASSGGDGILPHFPLTDIVIQTNHVLGKGGYGTVYRAYNRRTGHPLAMKECPFDEHNLSLVKQLRTEFTTLASLDHPHIVRVHHFTIHDKKRARIFLELMPGGSVRSVMRRFGGCLGEN